jgi:D-serine dehydratase
MDLLTDTVFAREPTPLALLREPLLDHNVALFARWCREHGVLAAPHAKTHMARELVERQLAAGAWGMTVATVAQATHVASWGVERLIVASEVVDAVGLDRLVALARDRSLVLFADSPAGVEAAAAAVARAGDAAPLRLVVELGHPGGRTGVRDVDCGERLAEVIAATDGVALAGVGAFEGTIAGDGAADAVVAFLGEVRRLAERLATAGLLPDDAIVTAGGSVHPHRVASVLDADWAREHGLRTVVRSGCYVSHDAGIYDAESPFGSVHAVGDERLLPALEVWGTVISVPEPLLAILNVGRRDVSYDAGLPVPIWRRRDGERTALRDAEVVALNDQHAYVRLGLPGALRVGDLVGCGISHPCTTFDRWRRITLVDDGDCPVGEVETAFDRQRGVDHGSRRV